MRGNTRWGIKRVLLHLAVICGIVALSALSVKAQTGEQENEIRDSLMDEMDLDEIQKTVEELLGNEEISFEETVTDLMNGKELFSDQKTGNILLEKLTGSLKEQKKLMGYLLVLVLAAAVLTNFAGLFENRQLGEMSFYMIYLLVLAMLVRSFSMLGTELKSVMSGMEGFMKAVSPAYYLAVAASVGASTATVFYQIILILITLVEKILIAVVLPGIQIYVLMEMINHLSKEDFLSRMAELLKSMIMWTMRTVVAVLVGMQVLQNMIEPAFDSLKRTMLGKTAGAIPGVGNALNAVTEMVLGSVVLIRNCIGVTAVLILLIAGISPVIRLAVTGFIYKFLAAFAQPVSDKRIVGCLNTMGEGCGLLLKLLFTVEILFILTIAILAGTVK